MSKRKETKAEKLKHHRYWLRYWVTAGKLAVKDRDWGRASYYFTSANIHKRVIEIVTAH